MYSTAYTVKFCKHLSNDCGLVSLVFAPYVMLLLKAIGVLEEKKGETDTPGQIAIGTNTHTYYTQIHTH